MRWMAGIILLLGFSFLGGYIYLKGHPYHLYSNWINGSGFNRYYEIANYSKLLLKPSPLAEIPPYQEDYVQLWKEFPVRNSLIPLPVRHPLFLTVPIVEFTGKNTPPQIGITILSSEGRELSQIYTTQTGFFQDYSQGQELFKLPYVKNRILKMNKDLVWKDVFTHEIVVKSKTLDEMIYDLYILHLRSQILPSKTLKYGMNKTGKEALVELASENNDYRVELVLTQNNGSVYSYVLRTEKSNEISTKLRSKFLQSINFSPVDSSMGRILYTEFKQLHFNRQVDQEGMLYLFSAWSQEAENVDLFKEMIFYLERGGPQNARQLKAPYQYAFKQWGKTFTTRKYVTGEDPELNLQQKIEIENLDKRQALEREKSRPAEEPDLLPEEKMNLYLKKAKEMAPEEAKEMTVH